MPSPVCDSSDTDIQPTNSNKTKPPFNFPAPWNERTLDVSIPYWPIYLGEEVGTNWIEEMVGLQNLHGYKVEKIIRTRR